MAVELSFERDPAILDRLAEELCAAAGVEPPEPREDGEDDDLGVLGAVVARSGGTLEGWAVLLAPDDEDDEGPHLQWALAAMEAEGLKGGVDPVRDTTDAEFAVVERMVREAAARAAELGHDALLWSPTQRGTDARLAERLGAEVEREEGRTWGAGAEWRRPPGLPPVRVRTMPTEPDDALLDTYVELYRAFGADGDFGEDWDREEVREWLDNSHLGPDLLVGEATFDLMPEDGDGVPSAQFTVLVDDKGTASAGLVVHRGPEPEALAGAFAEAVEGLRGAEGVREFHLQEFDDEIVAEAADRAGLEVIDRWPVYILELDGLD
ncbi:hypothetical protein [Nocardiopsis chromatogenes]|uniref:hypothetical protein n=1 Tax=Nocardiopsis chromatogenes TaxID=280239 RepID=UPI00034A83C0|nr:hypothetical protein [Nocardiopsis chromatogenes]